MTIRTEQREGEMTARAPAVPEDRREMIVMTHARAMVLAFAVVAASAAAAHAQGWPNSPPQAQGGWPAAPAPQQAPWPGSAQPAPQQSPWPAAAQPAPAQSPWPAAAQPAPAQGGWPGGGPGGPPPGVGMGMPGGGPTPEQIACMKGFTQYREDTEKRGLAAKAAGEAKNKPSREEFCKLVTSYSDAEAKWIKFTADNLSKCGIPKQILEQIKMAHSRTTEAKTKICSGGPMPGAAAPPSLSDALGSSSSLPTAEIEKRKTGGGTMDTLTGNALAR